MRIRHLYRRTRPFRYAGFWSVAICLAVAGCAEGRGPLRLGCGIAFCVFWPWLADRVHRPRAARLPAARAEHIRYVLECALVGVVFGSLGAPLLALFLTLVCLLSGAIALAGRRLLLPASLAMLPGLWAGAVLHPPLWAASTPVADGFALAVMLAFSLALGHLAFRQAQRLDAHRLVLASRSSELERQNGRMSRYLPPSLRQRLRTAPDAPAAWERRWLTVVFVDLAGFTTLAERLDPEALARVLDDCLGALIPAVERHGGEVSKLLGDGLLAVFGAVGEPGGADHRQALARCALAFGREAPSLLEDLAAGWRARGEPLRLHLRCGIASGYCTLGDRGAEGRLDFTVVGAPVNLASRLEALAELDGVLMDAASAALAGTDATPGTARRVEPKGLGERIAYVAPAPAAALAGGAEGEAPS